MADTNGNGVRVSWTAIGVTSQIAVWIVIAFKWFIFPDTQLADVAVLKQSQAKQDEDIKTLQNQLIQHLELDAKLQYELQQREKGKATPP